MTPEQSEIRDRKRPGQATDNQFHYAAALNADRRTPTSEHGGFAHVLIAPPEMKVPILIDRRDKFFSDKADEAGIGYFYFEPIPPVFDNA
jgi:hypothetical protein